MALRVAQLAGERPVLHVAVATEHLEGMHDGLETHTAGAQLRERDGNAPEEGALFGRVGAPGSRRALEGERQTRLEIDEQINEGLPHERIGVDPLSPLLAMRCVDRGFEP